MSAQVPTVSNRQQLTGTWGMSQCYGMTVFERTINGVAVKKLLAAAAGNSPTEIYEFDYSPTAQTKLTNRTVATNAYTAGVGKSAMCQYGSRVLAGRWGAIDSWLYNPNATPKMTSHVNTTTNIPSDLNGLCRVGNKLIMLRARSNGPYSIQSADFNEAAGLVSNPVTLTATSESTSAFTNLLTRANFITGVTSIGNRLFIVAELSNKLFTCTYNSNNTISNLVEVSGTFMNQNPTTITPWTKTHFLVATAAGPQPRIYSFTVSGISVPVKTTLSLSWDRRKHTKDTQDISWDRRKRTESTFNISWHRRKITKSILDISWKIETKVKSVMSMTWARRQRVGKRAKGEITSRIQLGDNSQTQGAYGVTVIGNKMLTTEFAGLISHDYTPSTSISNRTDVSGLNLTNAQGLTHIGNTILVIDATTDTLYSCTWDGSAITTPQAFTGTLNITQPSAMCVMNGKLIIADDSTNQLYQFDYNLTDRTISNRQAITTPPGETFGLTRPTGLTTLLDKLIVADATADAIYDFDYDPATHTISNKRQLRGTFGLTIPFGLAAAGNRLIGINFSPGAAYEWQYSAIYGSKQDISWDRRKLTESRLPISWDRRKLVKTILDITWSYRVKTIMSMAWDRRKYTKSALDVSWHRRTYVGKSIISISWIRRKLAETRLPISWDRRKYTKSIMNISWNRAGVLKSILVVSWDRRKRLGTNLPISWDRRKRVGAPTLGISWHRRKYIGKSILNLSWMRRRYTKGILPISWDRRKLVKSIISITWTYRVLTVLRMTWDRRTRVESRQDISWHRRRYIGKSIMSISWIRRRFTQSRLNISWDRRRRIEQSILNLSWHRLKRVGTILNLSWDRRTKVPASRLDISWNRRLYVGKSILNLSWIRRGRAKSIQDVSWDRRKITKSILTITWSKPSNSLRFYVRRSVKKTFGV